MKTLRDAIIELLRGQTMFIALRKRDLDMESPEYKEQIGNVMAVINEALVILTEYVNQFKTLLSNELPPTAKERIQSAKIILENARDHIVIDFTRSQNAEKLSEAAEAIKNTKDHWDKAREELTETKLQPAQQEAFRKAA